MEEYLELEIYDLQRAFDLLVLHTDQQAALKDAVEALHLEENLAYHDAGQRRRLHRPHWRGDGAPVWSSAH